MLPKNLSNADKFKLAKECGFEGIEGSPMDDLTVAEEIGKMARDAGVPIHSIVYGYSQDWIRTLGKRIVKIHLKDFKRKGYQCTNLLEGVVNFKQVRLALEEVGYDGFLTPELSGGDKAYLTDLSERIDLILAM